jgi:GH25 family lysozyme M1 (1,4-beta-N-acetylmuramidase)
MESIGVSCDWDLHCRIAQANGITDFSGTAEQNTTLLNLLKAGKLINPDGTTSDDSDDSGNSGSTNTGSNGYENGYAGGMAGDGTIYAHGLDVSLWQGENLDFNAIKNAGYSFVILRAGTTKGKDTCFETFYKNAKAAGLNVGAYYYSYATTVDAAKADADNMLSWISGKKFEYPLYFDYEDSSQDSLSSTTAQNICLAFMDKLANAGYLTGMYTSYYKSTLLPMDTICAKYEFWVANYYDYTYETLSPSYSTKYGMYQYTNRNYVGSLGPFDANVAFKDYPAIVKKYGFNGYGTEVSSSYLDKCTFYPSYCEFTTTKATPINSLPCAANTNGSKTLETAAADATYTAIALCQNAPGNLWYKVKTNSGEIGYIFAGHTTYVKKLTSDITLTNYDVPNGHVKGNVFYVTGNIKSTYNKLSKVKVLVFKGFGVDGEQLTGGTESIDSYSYLLNSSALDNATAFGGLSTGKHTYIISASYVNYYAASGTELAKNTGTKRLNTTYFMVISSAANQSTCSHSNSTTVLTAATCTTEGTALVSCSKCGLVTQNTVPVAHTYESTTVPPSGTTDGSVIYTCTACGYSYTEVLSNYLTKCTFYPAHCQVTTINNAPINSLPRSVSASDGSTTLETAPTGTTYTAVGLYLNTSGNYWYEVITASGETGYLFSGRTTYVGDLTTDITLDSYGYPDAHVKGSAFNATGTVSSKYNQLDSVNICVHQGFGLAGDLAVNASDSVTGNAYTLDGSTLAKAADLTGLTAGNHTYAIAVRYTNYYAAEAKELSTNQGVKYLCSDYFVVIPAAADQTTCSHQYNTTTFTEATCTTNGLIAQACSICGQVVQVTTAPAHTFGDWTVTTPATCTADGTMTHSCTGCGATESATISAAGHKYADGTCTGCGEADPDYVVPVVVPTLTGVSFSLSFESEILINFYYTATNTDDVVEQGMLVFYTDPISADIAKADDVYAGSVSSGNYFVNNTKGIAAKYMGDSRYYCAYAKLSNGTYAYSPLYQYSPKRYATNMLANSSTSKGQKALCVAMLNYGAAAQTYFGYRTDDLMNACLTGEQQALVTAYNSSLFNGAVAADASKTVNFAKTAAGFSTRKATVSFDGAFAINYYFSPTAEVVGNMKLYIWNPEVYAAVSQLTADNASAVVSMEAQTDGAHWGQVSGIAAKNLDKTYYMAGIYTDAEGNTYCTGVTAYSLSKYCMNTANGNMGQLAQATAMYGYYAAQFFGN